VPRSEAPLAPEGRRWLAEFGVRSVSKTHESAFERLEEGQHAYQEAFPVLVICCDS